VEEFIENHYNSISEQEVSMDVSSTAKKHRLSLSLTRSKQAGTEVGTEAGTDDMDENTPQQSRRGKRRRIISPVLEGHEEHDDESDEHDENCGMSAGSSGMSSAPPLPKLPDLPGLPDLSCIPEDVRPVFLAVLTDWMNGMETKMQEISRVQIYPTNYSLEKRW
jgi:hypothetical protein